MANDTQLTIVGNLVATPELRFTQSGVPVAGFTVASTPRTFNRQTNEWEDGEALFMRCSAWRDLGENVAESLPKGARVIVQGRLVQRAFTDRDGNNRTTVELQVDEVGPSLRYATAQPQKVQRNCQQGGGQQGGWNGGGQAQQGHPQGQPQQGGWSGQGGYDDPPFN